MKKIFTALVFCISSCLSFAQIHEWSVGFDTGGNSDKGISTCIDNQGNIIRVGSFSNNMDIGLSEATTSNSLPINTDALVTSNGKLYCSLD